MSLFDHGEGSSSKPVKPPKVWRLQEVRDSAVNFLARRDHSRSELERKLKRKKIPKTLIQQTLDWLEELGYLNDEKFARKYVAELRRKGFGPRMVDKKLWERGVAEEAPEEPESRESQEDRARELLERKFGELEELEPKTRARAARLLLRRGFDGGIVRDILGPLPRF